MMRRDTGICTHFVAGAGCFVSLGASSLAKSPRTAWFFRASRESESCIGEHTHYLQQRNIEKMRIALGPLLAYAMTRSARLRLATAPVLLSSQTRTHSHTHTHTHALTHRRPLPLCVCVCVCVCGDASPLCDDGVSLVVVEGWTPWN